MRARVPALAFAADERNLARRTTLEAINTFLIAKRREKLHPVPTRERSLHIFGDEKRLDNLRKTKTTLFEGRISLSDLSCYAVDVAAWTRQTLRSGGIPCTKSVNRARPTREKWRGTTIPHDEAKSRHFGRRDGSARAPRRRFWGDLAMHIERRPTAAELADRLAREPAFTFLDQDELLRSARRAINEGRGLDSRVLKPARERQKRVREALELDKDFDHAAPEDALSNAIFLGGPGLPKRRTLKVGGTRIRRNPPKP